MMRMRRISTTAAIPTLFASSLLALSGLTLGADGIASKYPRDRGIENDPKVVFVETFDVGSISALGKRWESVQNDDIMSLSAEVPAASGGGKSLLMTHVGGLGNGAGTGQRRRGRTFPHGAVSREHAGNPWPGWALAGRIRLPGDGGASRSVEAWAAASRRRPGSCRG